MLCLLQIAQLVESQQWPGLAIQNSIDGRGRGVVATEYFHQGDVVLDYHGKQISLEEDAAIIAEEDDRSCYLFQVIFVSIHVISFLIFFLNM